ncbi:hypothetical protein [Streptomyces sp. SLBN-31]|uniref:hypothetical protein n=1 Tax=unclassified Streptomyces TaxID=2593676 RepID=UPI00116D5C24|nr:hypothetical protein [Streptomyces sp. SLBN-31]TQJ86207.1 hypothetical protein FBY22_5012 [Streptomyces sp. SLBN-31]
MITVAALLQLLILAGALYDTARLLGHSAAPPGAARSRRRRAALETTERRLVERRLRGRIDAVAYREAMHALAEGRRARVRWRAPVWRHPHAGAGRTPVGRHPLAEGRRAPARRHPRTEGRDGH